MPEITSPVKFIDLMTSAGIYDFQFIADPSANSRSLADRTLSRKNQLNAISKIKTGIIVIGPEGGFSHHEINLAQEANFSIVSMGKRILRAETAALSLVSIIQYEWGDLNLGQGMEAEG